ncbi:probable 2-oxoglutarate-dependent dioxygenase AOP1 [Lotus japonicus]|uniref:probable 2-oxoglutarate-dependent dioxygenase AOP1 n=1 Tax=Lotus japonicus TaxID=34305 RepID=UPI002590F3AB|nr:probable 2-oxoglutarate-dependent dioxygenase AOP1 [Lotus japonicus]
MSKKVKEPCENHGCFLFMYDEIPKVLMEDMLIMCLQTLFDLPEETKRKYISPTLFSSYTNENPKLHHLSQSFGIDDAPLGDSAQAFTNLMWPQGNQAFCETLKFMSSKMLELNILIQKMIVESYGLPKQYTSDIKDMSNSNFRLMKYKVPRNHKDGERGMGPHNDKNKLTILCQNDAQGLQVLTKTNKWIPLNIPKDGFAVFVGDTLKAWSNGRLHAATHRVMMSRDKERYSFDLFSLPKNDMKIEVPPELVDDKIHPLRYGPFTYGDYIQYFLSTDLN